MTNFSPNNQPHLPPELERAIFELAAIARPICIPSLMLVARRTKEWLEPLLYRVIFVSESIIDDMHGFPSIPLDILLATIAKKPTSFFQSSGTRIFLENPPGMEPALWVRAMDTIFTACQGVGQLSIVSSHISHRGSLDGLHSLRRLTMHVAPLFAPFAIDFSSPIFRHLTHLEFLDALDVFPPDVDIGAHLALVPALTHISFHVFKHPLRAFHGRIRTSPHIQCIVCFVPRQLVEIPEQPDARLVCMDLADWQTDWLRGAAFGEDYWELAEIFIAAKHGGEVYEAQYFIEEWWRL
ncbi:hypothetical protein MSAN_01988600 [Mycena sanguinolenta]|uniref:Uncharacterized protein n=1 Tax=Mycena sanguinolenta TaxID=230812 RepID=A0A8H6XJI6_9AGAR|nr:hypothetical protein MSAN_01988600 [Mycena sanguinolenta]